MSAGTAEVMSSASQAAASVITSGVHAIQSGFFAVLSAFSTESQGSVGPSGGAVSVTLPAGAVTATFPPGAFATAVNVTASLPASFATGGAAAGLTATGVGVEITLDQAVQPVVNVTLTVSYRAGDIVGIDPETLLLARYDPTRSVWLPLTSSVDTLNRTVTARTDHLSVFQIMSAAPSDTLSTAKAFPNPLRPSRGDTPMRFSSLPAEARLRIYDLKGVLIKDLTADSRGMADWDGTNKAGVAVASGAYFVFIQGAGKSRTLNVAVQR